MGTKYVVICTTLRGALLPPEPVDAETQAQLEYLDRVEELRKLESVHWFDKPKRRRVA
ncbi:MAG: hypothetical protein KGL39_36300 [Patescibacteria group bacterium]|nr:hypothetical protein [Patescibacteria group bacterium]